jgi:hypothetical protein
MIRWFQQYEFSFEEYYQKNWNYIQIKINLVTKFFLYYLPVAVSVVRLVRVRFELKSDWSLSSSSSSHRRLSLEVASPLVSFLKQKSDFLWNNHEVIIDLWLDRIKHPCFSTLEIVALRYGTTFTLLIAKSNLDFRYFHHHD